MQLRLNKICSRDKQTRNNKYIVRRIYCQNLKTSIIEIYLRQRHRIRLINELREKRKMLRQQSQYVIKKCLFQ